MSDTEVTIIRIDEKSDQVRLSDGRVTRMSLQSGKRSQKTGPSKNLRTDPLARFNLILTNPDSYHLLDHIMMGTRPEGGSPGIYPRQLFSLIYALQNAFSSQSAISRALLFDSYLPLIKQRLQEALPTVAPDDQVRITNWIAAPKSPSASRISRLFRGLKMRGINQSDLLLQQGVMLSLDDERFSQRNTVYSSKNMMIGDGTALKAATSHTQGEVVDMYTGEIRQRHIDGVAQTHSEGGGESTHGTKFAIIWSPGPNKHDTIALGAAYVNSPSPQIEASSALKLTLEVQARLIEQGASASLLAYDRAAGRKEQETLNGAGMVLATRATMDRTSDDSSHYRKPKFIGTTTPECGHEQRFFAILKRLHLAVTDVNGKSNYLPLQHNQRPKRQKNGRVFHYTEHPYTCWCSPGTNNMLRVAWNGRKSALSTSKDGIEIAGDEGYDNMLRYLQPHAPDSEEFKEIYGLRQTAEAMHSIIDDMLPFKRLQRWSLESKEAWVFAYLIGHNLVYQQLRRQQTPDSAAG